MTVSLSDFLTTGIFGDVVLGMSDAEVRQIIGEPLAIGGVSNRRPHPSLLKYKSLELGFAGRDGRICTLLHIEPFFASKSFSFPDSIRAKDWDLTPASSRGEVEAYLFSKSFSFNLVENRRGEEIIVIDSRVHIVFDDDLLWSLSVSL